MIESREKMSDTSPAGGYIYDAFVSYNSEDSAFAVMLEKALENYSPPRDLAVPQRHLNIFRDEEDLIGVEYYQSIDKMLQDSAKLIVICSPNSRNSQYVNDEIRRFAKLNSIENIILVIIAGEPDNEGEKKAEKAFPTALFEVMEMPLAKDYRGFNIAKDRIEKSPFKNAWYGLLSDIYDKSRREIEERDSKKRFRRRRITAAIVGAIFIALSSLTIYAVLQQGIAEKNAEDAKKQQKIAEAQSRIAEEERLRANDNARATREQRAIAVAESGRAADSAREAQAQRTAALDRLYQANYNQAKVFEEKAGDALQDARTLHNSGEYQKALFYTLIALEQDIGSDNWLPLSWSRMASQEVFNWSFREIWRSPVSPGAASSVAFSPDGKTLASAAWAATIRLFDVASGAERAVLSGHSSGVKSVAFSPDGKTLASASRDTTIRLWNVASGAEHAILRGHSSSVYSVAFSPDGMTLASASDDRTIRLFDVASGAERTFLDGHSGYFRSVAFSPDGKTLASGSEDNSISLWDVASGAEHVVINGHSGSVRSLAFSPDGKTLASASGDKTIRLWDVASGAERAVLNSHSNGVNSVAFSPDGKTLASAAWDKTIRLWDVAGGVERAVLNGHSSSANSVAFSPDGKTLASGSTDATIRLWDVAVGAERAVLRGHSSWVRSVAFSPDGKTLASAAWSRGTPIRLWDVASGVERAFLSGHSGYVRSLAFSPDGKTLASASTDDPIHLWNVGMMQTYIRAGKEAKLWKRFKQAVYYLFPHRLDGFLLESTRRPLHFTPLDGYQFPEPRSFEKLDRPRPLVINPLDWILENMD